MTGHEESADKRAKGVLKRAVRVSANAVIFGSRGTILPSATASATRLRSFLSTSGYEYQQKYGAPTETFAEVRAKASRHAEHNDKAIFRKVVSAQEVMESPNIFLNAVSVSTTLVVRNGHE